MLYDIINGDYNLIMTELVNKLNETVETLKHITTEDITQFLEIAVLIGTFVFCVYAVSPII